MNRNLCQEYRLRFIIKFVLELARAHEGVSGTCVFSNIANKMYK